MSTTHPAAQPDDVERKSVTVRQPGQCSQKCAGGNECAADSKYRHQIHYCNEPNCICREVLRGKVVRR